MCDAAPYTYTISVLSRCTIVAYSVCPLARIMQLVLDMLNPAPVWPLNVAVSYRIVSFICYDLGRKVMSCPSSRSYRSYREEHVPTVSAPPQSHHCSISHSLPMDLDQKRREEKPRTLPLVLACFPFQVQTRHWLVESSSPCK